MSGQLHDKQGFDNLTGNVLLFYSFDVGDEVSFSHIKDKGLVMVTSTYTSPVFKYYQAPISFKLREEKKGSKKNYESYNVFNKIYDFGVLSFCYRIPFTGTLESLKTDIGAIKQHFDAKSERDAQVVFNAIAPALVAPDFYNIKNSYIAIQVNPTQEHINPDEFKER